MRLASILTLMFLAFSTVSGFAAEGGRPGAALSAVPASPAVTAFATLSGEFRSMAVLPDRGVLLLASSSIVEVSFDGTTRVIQLPVLAGPQPEAGLSDLAVRGSKVVFCRFVEPALYFLDLTKPTGFERVALTGLPEGRMEFAEIGVLADGFVLVNANGGAVLVDDTGAARALPATALPIADRAGKPLLLDAPKVMNEKNLWSITGSDGKSLFTRTDPAKDLFLQALKPLGFAPDGRLFVLEVTGTGERRETRSVLAIEEGKVASFKTVPSSDPGPLVRAHLVASDGSIVFATDAGSGKIALHRLAIP